MQDGRNNTIEINVLNANTRKNYTIKRLERRKLNISMVEKSIDYLATKILSISKEGNFKKHVMEHLLN